ncbi:MAG: HAMP domain-containing sensor histidine kinase [Bacteroidota bacterium]
MSRLKDLQSLLLPRRASTQTWMMLTFALFVGAAVAIVGLYAFLVLRGQVEDAARETLRVQARYLSAQLETVEDPEVLFETIQRTSTATPYRIGVAKKDSLVWEMVDGRILTDRTFLDQPEVEQAVRTGFGYDERTGSLGPVLYVAHYSPVSDYVVRIGQPAPPLLTLVQKMQATLIIGMALALVLALIGAWIAALQVTRPLKAISKSARRVNEGDLDREIVVRTRAAEVQDLASSLNSMAERFREDIYELQRVARVQNEFIGNVSHEVKNPIFAVGGYLEALDAAGLSDAQRQKYVAKGLLNLQRLNNLFGDLIEIAKLEYREDLIRPEVFDLQGLLGEVAEMLEPKAEDKGLALVYQNQPVEVWADRSRIRQVLTNLIDNAISYSDAGTVKCRMRRHLDKVRIEVVDTGRGIAEDHLERIFERFYRVDNARSRAQGGTGLGLAITKQILQAHGEQIHVESTAGRGTRFWFELLLAESVPEYRAAASDTFGEEVEVVL